MKPLLEASDTHKVHARRYGRDNSAAIAISGSKTLMIPKNIVLQQLSRDSIPSFGIVPILSKSSWFYILIKPIPVPFLKLNLYPDPLIRTIYRESCAQHFGHSPDGLCTLTDPYCNYVLIQLPYPLTPSIVIMWIDGEFSMYLYMGCQCTQPKVRTVISQFIGKQCFTTKRIWKSNRILNL